MTDSKAHDKG